MPVRGLRRVLPWLPVVAWMALIFSFSSLREPRFASTPLLDLVIKKAGHFGLYLVLAFGLAFAFQWSLNGTKWGRWTVRLAFALAVAFAMTDELHQVFTPTRDPSPVDVGIDSLGVLAGVWVWQRARLLWRQRVGRR